jgi:hypothetical protein
MRFIVDAKDPGHNLDVLKPTRFLTTWRVYEKILAAAQAATKLPYSQPRISGSQINARFSLLLLPLVFRLCLQGHGSISGHGLENRAMAGKRLSLVS